MTFSGALTNNGTGATVQVDAGHTLWLNGGEIEGGTITNNGTIEAGNGSSIDAQNYSGTGTLVLEGGNAEIVNTVANGRVIDFAAANGTLTLDNASSFGGTVAGFISDQQAIDLGGIGTANTVGTPTIVGSTSSTTTIDVSDGVNTATIVLDGHYTTGNLQLSSFSSGGVTGTAITINNDVWNGTNWSSGTPTANTFAAIAPGAALTVSSGIIAAGLVVEGTSATVSVTGAADLDVTGALINSGTISVGQDASLTVTGDVDNYGTIEASDGGTLVLDTAPAINSGTIEVMGGATLQLDDSVDNTGGTISASGSSSSLTLDEGMTLTNGALTVGSGATLFVEGAGATLDGVTVTNSGIINVDLHTITTTPLILDDGTTITGGTLSVGPAGEVEIQGTGAGATLGDVAMTLAGTATTTGTISVGSGKTLTLAGTDTIAGGAFGVFTGSAQAAAGNSVLLTNVSIADLNPGNAIGDADN